jgi:chromosome segregation protein
LLKLRKVEMLGFKSFCEKTTITFSGTGITCIVGPNGCGKSNVVDAISWVLGEQSHKSLRAERMTDCIFNGTAKRAPLGYAEVSLTLVDPELAAAADFVMGKEETREGGEVKEAAGAGAAGAGPHIPGTENTEIAGSGESIAPESAGGAASSAPAATFIPKKKREPKPAMHTRPGEVVVGRRLYRSGQSEYLINGRVARLRDIQELFMGTGLGPESYAIIEQGRIGQILSSKPMDRRAIIEEAAGVSKYKTKRRLAETKLEASKLNLARVFDILVEVEKQLASLKRQASKARRYAEIREAMRGIQRTVLASKARELEQEAERLGQLLHSIGVTEATEARRLAELEAEQERLHARSYELEGAIRRNANLLGECTLELDRAENRIGFNRQRLLEMEQRAAQLTASLEQSAAQIAEVEAQARAHATSVAAIRGEKQQSEDAVTALAGTLGMLTEEQTSTDSRLAALRNATESLGEELTRLHGEQAQAEAAWSHLTEARGKAEFTQQKFAAENARHIECVETCEARARHAEARARELSQAVRDEQARIAELRQRRTETAERFDGLREQLAAARARRGSLEQILSDRSYTADAVQKLFAANGDGEARGFRAVGVLADYAEVEEQHEAAVEQFLSEELEYVVVETFDHARAGVSLLRNEVGGRATFFVDSLNKLNLAAGEAPLPFTAEQGVLSRLDQLVNFKDPLGAAAKQFLPKLRSAYLVETAERAEALAGVHRQHYFVTPEGTCYHGRLVTGGRPGEAGPLAMKRELRLLESETARLERAVSEAQAGLDWLGEETRRCEEALDLGTAQHLNAEKDHVAAIHLRDAARTELERTAQSLREAQMEMARLNVETETALRRAERARAEREDAMRSRAQAEVEATEAVERLNALRTEIAERQEELSTRRAELATMAERLAGAEAIEQRHAATLHDAREREEGLRSQRAAAEVERTELGSGTEQLVAQVSGLSTEKARLGDEKSRLEAEFEQARVRTVQLDDMLRAGRQQLGDLREERSRHEIERARNESDRSHLRETCLAEVNAHPEDLLAQETALISGEELAAADASYREMKARIEAMGAVNMLALEEYQECEQRFAFLSRERDDLVKSIEDTRQTIAELDETCAKKFAEAFEVINRNFSQAFTTLFGGGAAEMRMGEADADGEPGIDIIAQPPGKRLQNVLLLSGGEKALTAVSLLIAIFRYTPSPFCILDEVDAPLDEANVGRFNRLLGEMSAQTQFIIVTHNRRTMEMAPVLYGVTMQEPGVSKLVSVRWDEPVVNSTPQTTAA